MYGFSQGWVILIVIQISLRCKIARGRPIVLLQCGVWCQNPLHSCVRWSFRSSFWGRPQPGSRVVSPFASEARFSARPATYRVHNRVLPEADDRMRRTFHTRMLYSDYSCLWMYITLYAYNDGCNAECGLQLWNKVHPYLLTFWCNSFSYPSVRLRDAETLLMLSNQ